ncbi:MAG: Sec-dependent nitrous-oxide reductase [Acidimicrobiia bacterium]|nr:Sec-dependent nitrous-oxide reductase [Acidimicrobiia bacterium]
MNRSKPMTAVVLVLTLTLVAMSCSGGGSEVDSIAKERGLSQEDIENAVSTYTPSGEHDPYIMISSGGHGGQLFVIGVPSMRLLRSVGVFTPEPWQGWGYGGEASAAVLDAGNVEGKEVRWGDTHHPALSETKGEYDGQMVFINDKANARMAVVDLRDFETKQIVKNPLAINDHGGAFVTPDTEWVLEGGTYATPLPWSSYAPISEYQSQYRGMITFWKFDREARRIIPEQSFAMELPPYWQDLCDAGKLESEGWVFCNSFNTEMATGGIEQGNPPFEAGVSENDMDYLHAINLKKAAEVAQTQAQDVNGFKVLPLSASIQEGLLYFMPEPKSPHGADVTPKGDFIVVAGKLDPHVTIYSFEKIQAAIEKGTDEKDQFGVPVLDFDATKEAQVELGLGPLHTQFDNEGHAYTSLFLDSAVARWSLGGDYHDEGWELENSVPVQYNIGHISTPEGDTVSPDGQYVVALNKWSIDRFFPTGPLLPQNFQLIDNGVSEGQEEDMRVMYDMPIGNGEPHSVQIIKADKLDPFEIYPEVGWDPGTMAVNPNAAKAGEERIERNGNNVEIWSTAIRSHFNPEHVQVQQGDNVTWHITNLEQSQDATHGFSLPGYNIQLSLEPGEAETIRFVADKPGIFTWYCSEFCSALHLEMMGYFMVQPPA